MPREWLGAISNDEGYFASIDPEAQSSSILHSVSGTIQPTGVESDVEGLSRAGLLYTQSVGGESIGGTFMSTENRFMFYLWAQTVTFQFPPSALFYTRLLHTTHSPVGATVALAPGDEGILAVGAELVPNSSTQFRFTLFRWSGSSWSFWVERTGRYVGTPYFLSLEVDTVEGDRRATLYVDGHIAIDRWFGTAPIIAGPTPAFYNDVVQGAGGGYQHTIVHEVLVASGDSPRELPPYASATSGYHVLAYYPVEDALPFDNAWSQVGSCDPSQKFRTVRDPEYAAPPVSNDRIESSAGWATQLFSIDDAVAASGQTAIVEAVYIAVCKKSATENLPSRIIARDSPGAYKHSYLGTAAFGWRYAFLPTPPGGGLWEDKFNTFQAGVRNHSNTLERCYGLIVGAIGRNLRRPPQYPDCPRAGRLRGGEG